MLAIVGQGWQRFAKRISDNFSTTGKKKSATAACSCHAFPTCWAIYEADRLYEIFALGLAPTNFKQPQHTSNASKGTTGQIQLAVTKIFVITCMARLSLDEGKGISGHCATSRNRHRGAQPSFTLYMRSLSSGTVVSTSCTCFE